MGAYDEETGHGDESHNNLTSLPECEAVDGDEGLRGVDAKDGVESGRAEEEEDEERLQGGGEAD